MKNGIFTLSLMIGSAFSINSMATNPESNSHTNPAPKNLVKSNGCTARPRPDFMTRWTYADLRESVIEDLEWELDRSSSKSMAFWEAEAYAKSRQKDGWRLPSIWELHALYQQKEVLGEDLDIDEWFWSDTAEHPHVGVHWALDFRDGSVNPVLDFHKYRVRLVRNIKP